MSDKKEKTHTLKITGRGDTFIKEVDESEIHPFYASIDNIFANNTSLMKYTFSDTTTIVFNVRESFINITPLNA